MARHNGSSRPRMSPATGPNAHPTGARSSTFIPNAPAAMRNGDNAYPHPTADILEIESLRTQLQEANKKLATIKAQSLSRPQQLQSLQYQESRECTVESTPSSSDSSPSTSARSTASSFCNQETPRTESIYEIPSSPTLPLRERKRRSWESCQEEDEDEEAGRRQSKKSKRAGQSLTMVQSATKRQEKEASTSKSAVKDKGKGRECDDKLGGLKIILCNGIKFQTMAEMGFTCSKKASINLSAFMDAGCR